MTINVFTSELQRAFSFRERRESFFAQGVNTKDVIAETAESKKANNNAESEKDKSLKEQETANVFDIQRQQAKNLLNAASKKDEKAIHDIQTLQKQGGIWKDIFNTVLKSDFSSAKRTEITKILNEIESEKKRDIEMMLGRIREKKKFNKQDLKILSKYSIVSVLNEIEHARDKKIFIRAFANIESRKLNDTTQVFYERLGTEIGTLLEGEHSNLNNKEKKVIFEKYVQLRCTATKNKNFNEVAKDVIEEQNIDDAYIRAVFMKSWVQRMLDISGITSAIEDKSERSTLLENEQKMYEIVESLGDKKLAEKARMSMEAHEKADEKSRAQAFFDAVNEEVIPRIHALQDIGIATVEKEINKSEKLLKSLIDIFPGLSEKEKSLKNTEISNGYKVLREYLKALKESQVDQNNLPILKFFFVYTKDKKVEGFLSEKFELFTKKEANQIYVVEQERIILKRKLDLASEQYLEKGKTIKSKLDSDKFQEKSLSDQIAELRTTKLVTPEGAMQLVSHDKRFKPEYFTHVAKIQNKYGFSATEINNYIKTPEINTLPRGVVNTILQTDTVAENIYRFFEHDRVTKGVESIMNQLTVQEGILTHNAEKYGWMEKGEKAKASEVYKNFISKEKAEERLEKQKEEIVEVENQLRERAENSTTYKKLFINAANFLHSENSKIVIPLNDAEWLDESTKFSYKLSRLIKKDNKSRRDIINGIKLSLAKQSAELETILSPIQHALKSGNDVELAFCLNDDLKLPNSPEKPSLDELSWTAQSPLFHIMAKGEGLTPAGVLEIQKLMTKENKYSEIFIQSRSMLDQKYNLDDTEFGATGNYQVYFLPDKEFIVLPDDIYSQIKNFDSHSADIGEIDEALGFIFHEQTHNLVQASGHEMLTDFETLLRDKIAQFSEFENKANAVFEHNKGSASALEEVLANVGSMLQFPRAQRESILSDLEANDSYGMGLSLRKLVNQVFTEVGEKDLKTLFSNHVNFTHAEKENIGNAATADAGQNIEDVFATMGESENTENNESSEKKDVPLSPDKRAQKLGAFNEIKKDSFLYMKQLKESRGLFPLDQQKKLDDWMEYFENKLDDIESNIAHIAQTENDADAQIKNANDTVKDKAKGFVYQVSSANQDSPNFLMSAWDNTEFLSMSDIGQIFTTTWEYIKRRHGTRQKRRVGKVGHNMFNGIVNGLAGEFDKESLNAENTEVGEIQGALENKSDKEVLDFLREVSNPDSLKAVMQELAKRGLILWEEKEGKQKNDWIYIKKLREMGASVRFYESDFIYDGKDADSQSLLYSKLNKAFIQIYGDDSIFNKIFNENKGNINSRIEEGVKVSDQRGGQEAQLQEWLKMAHNNEFVPWHDFEGYIQFMVGDGTIDPAHYMYYLIMGVKEGAITKDAFMRFYKVSNDFPPSDEIRKWTTEEIINAANQILPPGHESWEGVPDSYIPWVHANIMTSPTTVERTTMNLAQGKLGFDHDNAHLLASVGDSSTARSFLALSSTGKQNFKDTMYNQAILGVMQNITSLGMYNEKGGIDFGTLQENIRRQAGYFATFDGIGSQRVKGAREQQFFTKSFYEKKPRAGDGYNSDMNTKAYLDMGRAIFSQGVDADLVNITQRFIFNNDGNKNAEETARIWNEEISVMPVMQKIFQGESIPKMDKSGKDSDKVFTDVVDYIFTYFLGDNGNNSPNAKANVLAIANAANSIANGKGVPGVPGSESWGYTSLSPEAGKTSKLPDRFKEAWK